jgi:hypothetical protein
MYVRRLFIAISVLINVILGGYSNQTFSARNYGWKLRKLPNLVWLIDTILFFEKDHCKGCYDFWLALKATHPDIHKKR